MSDPLFLTKLIYGFITGISADAISEAFIWITLIVFIANLMGALFWKENRFSEYAPTLLTSIGILGTFAGIMVGLIGFKTGNAEAINASIPVLLEGLKTAFITSLAGMLSSVAYKSITTLPVFQNQEEAIEDRDVGAAEIYGVLQQQHELMERLIAAIGGDGEKSLMNQMRLFKGEMNDNHKELKQQIEQNSRLFKAQTQILTTLQHGLIGTEEGSLSGQIKLLRSDIHDHFKALTHHQEQFAAELWQRLTAFAEMLSKSATDTVINALKEVISDFNHNLTEQFGDNFKHLNAAVDKLVDWQESYRLQLAQMIEQYQQGVNAIESTLHAVSAIEQATQAIPTTMTQLQAILTVNQHQIEELARHLEAFAAVRDRAVAAYPQIREQLDRVMEEMKGTVQSAQVYHSRMVEETQNLITGYASSGEKLLTQFVTTTEEGMSQIRIQFEQGANAFTEQVQGGLERVQLSLDQGANHFSEQISASADKVSDRISAHAETFEVQTQRMGESLTTSADHLQQQGEVVQQQIGEFTVELNSGLNQLITQFVTAAEQGVEQIGAQLEQSANAFTEQVQGGLERVQLSLDQGATHFSEQISASADKVSDRISAHAETLEAQTQRMGESLTTSADHLQQQGEAVRQQMSEMVVELNAGVRYLMTHLAEGSQEVTDQLNNLVKMVNQTSQTLNSELSRNEKIFIDGIQRVISEYQSGVTKISDTLNNQAKNSLAHLEENINLKINFIDQVAENEIKRVMQEMTNSLGAITAQFTKDYKLLVKDMKAVVNTGKSKQ